MPLLLYYYLTIAATGDDVVVALLVDVLRACNHPLICLFYDQSGHKILKQAKLGQFSTYWTETGQGAHKKFMYHTTRPSDCTDLFIEHH